MRRGEWCQRFTLFAHLVFYKCNHHDARLGARSVRVRLLGRKRRFGPHCRIFASTPCWMARLYSDLGRLDDQVCIGEQTFGRGAAAAHRGVVCVQYHCVYKFRTCSTCGNGVHLQGARTARRVRGSRRARLHGALFYCKDVDGVVLFWRGGVVVRVCQTRVGVVYTPISIRAPRAMCSLFDTSRLRFKKSIKAWDAAKAPRSA